VKANVREALGAIEAILDNDNNRIVGAKRAKDSGEGWPSVDSEKNGDADEGKKEYDIRLSAFITYCERGMSSLSIAVFKFSKCAVESKDVMIRCILDDLFQFFFFWISTCVLWRVLLYAGLNITAI
jgi:hypothetical protein